MLRFGLLVNPVAGLGGRVAMKGSDGEAVQQEARRRGGISQGQERTRLMLENLQDLKGRVRLLVAGGSMGEEAALAADWPHEPVTAAKDVTRVQDTEEAVLAFLQAKVDLIIFAGGDGTARDVYRLLGESLPVLGLPSGVKMQSAVFAITPGAAAEVLRRVLTGGLVKAELAEVRDLDEAAYRRGKLESSCFGRLLVPSAGHFMQQIKQGGREAPELVQEEIAASVLEYMEDLSAEEPDQLFFVGAGSTTRAVMNQLGLPATLAGVDVVQHGRLHLADAMEQQLFELASQQAAVAILSVVGGQGYLLGRGSQQFSPRLLRLLGRERLLILAGREKIAGLEGRPLLLDTGDPQLDKSLSGWVQVLCGYQETLLCRLGQEDAAAAKTASAVSD